MPNIHSTDNKNEKINRDDIVVMLNRDYENLEFPQEFETKIILKSGIKTVWEFYP